jgi:hypothetical protein
MLAWFKFSLNAVLHLLLFVILASSTEEQAMRDGMFRSAVRVTVTATKPGDPPAVEVTPPSDLVVVVVTAITVRKRRPASELTVTAKTVTDEAGRTRVVISVGGEITRGRIIRRSVWIDQQALLAAHTLRVRRGHERIVEELCTYLGR